MSINQEHFATYGYPFTRQIDGFGMFSVQTRCIEKVRRYYAVLLRKMPSTDHEEIQIAVSNDGEDWNTFFTRVLDILTIYENEAVCSYIVENRATFLYEAGVSKDKSVSKADDSLMENLVRLSRARSTGDSDSCNRICDGFKGPDGEYP